MASHTPAPLIAAATSALLFLTGCIPYESTERPGVEGIVVDATTHRPIAGAVVVIQGPAEKKTPTSFKITEATKSQSCVTGSDGELKIPGIHHIWLTLPIGDRTISDPSILTIQSSGYSEFTQFMSAETEYYELGQIELKATDDTKH
jgi:hypothetical protein